VLDKLTHLTRYAKSCSNNVGAEGRGMSWDVKLKRLQENLSLTQENLAGTLGITTRTLADFMKPVSEGGREPTGPVQRLIELLSGELDSQFSAKKPQLNLVIIHGDFRVPAGQEAVSTVVDMHAAAGRQINNEFHYVTVEPERDKKWALEGLLKRRVQPHFFICEEPRLSNEQARDCYFTTTAAWLATKAMQRDLAHITLAADPNKFWPLARELKELADVDVTFVREATASSQETATLNELMTVLRQIGIGVADPSGRKFGRIAKLKKNEIGSSDISFGFISQEDGDQNGTPATTGASLFFSWAHMRKGPDGRREMEISDLVEGDTVSFTIGMNNEGPCATEVALVKRAPGAPAVSSASAGLSRRQVPQEKELLDILKDAVSVCANEGGWALLSHVGSRISVLRPDFKDRLQSLGHQKIIQVAANCPEVFEFFQPSRPGTEQIRLKDKKS
jgi:hypothetical protein